MLSVLLVLRGISAQCLTGNDSPSVMSAGSKKAIIDSKFRFALETLKKISLFESQDNIIYSPYSIHQAVTLAYFGSRGTTEEALKRALQLPADISKVDVQRYYSFENTLKQQINGQVRRLKVERLHHYCLSLQVFQGKPHNRATSGPFCSIELIILDIQNVIQYNIHRILILGIVTKKLWRVKIFSIEAHLLIL